MKKYKDISILIVLLSGLFSIQAQNLLNVDYPAATSLVKGELNQEVKGKLPDTVYVTSLNQLAKVIKSSGRHIIMAPGVYQMVDYLTPAVIGATEPDAINHYAMLKVSGSNNVLDLTGVTIEVATELLNDFGKYVIEFYIAGDHNIIKGLTLTDLGIEPTASGGNSFTVEGFNNRIENVTLNVRGSFPYGYGDLLGKGGGSLVSMKKHSGMLISGLNDTIVNCTIISRSFGHCFFVQGGRNIHFENCYAEGDLRATSDMLAETSGPAYNLDFACVYTNRDGEKVIPPGYTKSTVECGFRTYGGGGVEGAQTGAVSAVNCKAKNCRIGFALTKVVDPMYVENCEAVGCEAGYNITGTDVIASKGDASIGPLLYINKGDACNVELTLLPDTSATIVHAIACVIGSGHRITLLKDGENKRPKALGILLGTSRPSGSNPFSPFGSVATSNVTLTNTTEMPVELAGNTSSCTVTSNGQVSNAGSNNTIITE